jgi:hypothetical protein
MIEGPHPAPRRRRRRPGRHTQVISRKASRQLRLLALETDGTVRSLLAEALNDLFTKHHRPPIA